MNKGKRWSEEEDARLKQERHDKTHELLAVEHGRTPLAIELRLAKFGAEELLTMFFIEPTVAASSIKSACEQFHVEPTSVYKVLLGMKPQAILTMLGLLPEDLDVDALMQKPGKPAKESPEDEEPDVTAEADPEEAAQQALDKKMEKWTQAMNKLRDRPRHVLKNAGKPWHPKEREELRKELAAGASLKDIAIEHGRSVTAVTARVGEIAAKEVSKDGIPSRDAIAAIARKYGIKPGHIYRHVDWAGLGVPQWTQGRTVPPVTEPKFADAPRVIDIRDAPQFLDLVGAVAREEKGVREQARQQVLADMRITDLESKLERVLALLDQKETK